MITGLYTCMADSVPQICITGQAPTSMLHKEAFQAVDIVDIAKPVTKWAVQVKEPSQLVWTFREAFRVAREGRPGPVLIDLPLDVTKSGMEVDFDPRRGGRLPFTQPAPNPNAIRQVVEMILEAERPMLMPGGGVIIADASEELVDVAEYLQVPVSPTYMGKGTIPRTIRCTPVSWVSRPSSATPTPSSWRATSSWGSATAGPSGTQEISTYRGDRKFIHIDIDPGQLGRVFQPDLAWSPTPGSRCRRCSTPRAT